MDQIEWIFNGLVVQEINNDPNGGFQQQYGYQGLGRYDSWTLRYETDHISKMLTSKMENKWFSHYNETDDGIEYFLEVVPCFDFLKKYLKKCNEKKIPTRILYVESERNTPIADFKVPIRKFLGYDYGSSQAFYSLLYEEVLDGDIDAELRIFKSRLNENGMFNSPNDLLEYVQIRNDLIHDGFNLETHADCCMMRVSVVEEVDTVT